MLRKILLSLLVLILLAAGGLFALLATNSDIIIDRFHSYVESSTGAPLVTSTRPEFTLFPNRGLELGAGSWEKPDGTLSISFSKASVLISSHALFSGRFSIKYFSMDDLDLTLKLKRPLREYLSRIPEGLEQRRDLDEVIHLVLKTLNIAPDAIEIRRGRVCLIEPNGNTLLLEPFTMTARDVHPGEHTDFNLSTSVAMSSPNITAKLDIDCAALFTSNTASLTLQNVSFIPGSGFAFTESIALSGGVGYDLTADSVTLSNLQFLGPDISASATGSVASLTQFYSDPRQGDASVKVDLKGDLRRLSNILHKPLPFIDSDIFTELVLSTELRWQKGRLLMNSLKGNVNALTFAGKLNASLLPFTLNGELHIGDLNIDAYRSHSFGKSPIRMDQNDFNGWPKVDLQLHADHLRWDKIHLENVNSRVTGQNGTYEMNPLTAIVAESPVTASIKAVMLPTSPLSARLTTNFSIPQARLEAISTFLLGQPVLSGVGALNAALSFTSSKGLSSLNGNGSLTSSQVNTSFSILPATIPFAGSVTASNSFDRLMLSFQAKTGLVDIRKFSLSAPRVKLTGEGHIDLSRKMVDAEGSVQISGTSVMPVKIKGSLKSPDYSLNSPKNEKVYSDVSIELDLDLPKRINSIISTPR